MYVCMYMSACLSVCLYVCMYVCLSVCLSVCLYVCMSVCLPVWGHARCFAALGIASIDGWILTSTHIHTHGALQKWEVQDGRRRVKKKEQAFHDAEAAHKAVEARVDAICHPVRGGGGACGRGRWSLSWSGRG